MSVERVGVCRGFVGGIDVCGGECVVRGEMVRCVEGVREVFVYVCDCSRSR